MTDDERLHVSLQLKAARYLAGTRATTGKHKGTAIPMRTIDLAKLPQLVENRITRSRLEDIEQMRGSEARAMELDKIVEAMGLPATWFSKPEGYINRSVATKGLPLPGGDLGRSGASEQPSHEVQARSSNRRAKGDRSGNAK